MHKLVVTLMALSAILISTQSFATKRALVVGVEQYKNFPKLNGPKYDAENFARFLQDNWGYQKTDIKVLLDEQATSKNFLTAIDQWLIGSTNPGDDVVIYYSGHGTQINDIDNDESDGYDEALALYDVKVSNNKSFVNVVTDDQIAKALARANGRNIRMIIDSCHSGDMARSTSLLDDRSHFVKSLVNPHLTTKRELVDLDAYRADKGFIPTASNIVVWTAASAFQLAFTDIERKIGSVFTNRFIEGIEKADGDLNKDGRITTAELFDYLSDESNAFCKRNSSHCTLGLKPTLEAPNLYYLANQRANIQSSLLAQNSAAQPQQQTPVISVEKPSAEQTKLETTADGQSQDANPDRMRTIEIAQDVFPNYRDFKIQASLAPQKVSYRLGEVVEYLITSEESGFLMLIDIDANGKLTQLYPNDLSGEMSEHFIQANTAIVFPPKWLEQESVISEPLGRSQLIAVVSKEPLGIGQLQAFQKDLIVENPQEYLGTLSAMLRQTVSGGSFNRRPILSVVHLDYNVVP